MPRYIQEWEWEEAFQRDGFGDGDDWVGTGEVERYLEELGYAYEEASSIHNTYIVQVSKDGHLWENDGGDEPMKWLPPDLVEKLAEYFHPGYFVQPYS